VQDEEKPSKTQRKREMHELQELGARLVELNPGQLDEIGLPEDLRDAIEFAQRTTKHEARRRQLQYIGKLMRSVDPAPIREKLKIWDGISVEHTAKQHRVERWRDRLIEDESAVEELLRAHPGIDARHLRALARKARAERAAGSPPRAYRELFRALRAIVLDPAGEHGPA
jgi:ribosome-associated protein